MKSVSKLSATLLFAAATLLACAGPSPSESATRELQSGGELYVVLGTSALQNHTADIFSALERGVAESSMRDGGSLQSALTILRASHRLFGLHEIAVLGASSIRDAELGFSNRVVVAAVPQSAGWLWRTHGRSEQRLARLGKLPADTSFALDFGVDLHPVIEDLGRSGCEKMLARKLKWLPMLSTGELLESLSGDWQIAISIPDGSKWEHDSPPLTELEKCDIWISAPDNLGSLKKAVELWRSLSPSAKQIDNVTYVPVDDKSVLVFVTLERRIMLFSSMRSFEKFRAAAGVGENARRGTAKTSVPGGQVKTLADTPDFAGAMKRLPANSHAAYFTSDANISRVLKLGGENGFQMNLPKDVKRSTGVWSVGDRMIVNREFSTAGLTTKTFDALIGSPLLLMIDKMLKKSFEAQKQETNKVSEKSAEPVKGKDHGADIRKAVAGSDKAVECCDRLRKIGDFIGEYRKKNNGELPAAIPEAGCGSAAYVYFAPFAAPPSGKMPLVVDPIERNAHKGTVNVLFVDGSIESFDMSSGSLKRLCSFLYTIYRYDEKEFIRLIERASQLDAAGGKRP